MLVFHSMGRASFPCKIHLSSLVKQLVVYFSFAYLISWLIWLPLYGPVFGLRPMPVIPYNHALGGLGPLLSAFLTTLMFDKKAGVRKLAGGLFKVRPFSYILVALLSPFLIVALAVLVNTLLNGAPADLTGLLRVREFPGFNLGEFFIYNLIFFGFGEETGWRGFALPRFQQRRNALGSSALLTVFWALWHWPLFFYRPGYMSMHIPDVVGWILSLFTGSILLTWLFNSTRGSILACAIFHATIDIAFTADIADKNVVGITGFLVTLWGILILAIFKAKHLAKVNADVY